MFQRAINNMTPVEVLMFLKSWLQEPLRVGAIAPSGSVLADIITSEVSASTGHVIELGPGRALSPRGFCSEVYRLTG